MKLPNAPHLSSAMQATSTATARPCASAGCSLPPSSMFSMTETQPTNTKNAVPTSSATHGWTSRSKVPEGRLTSCLLVVASEPVSISWSRSFSSVMLWHCTVLAVPLGPNDLENSIQRADTVAEGRPDVSFVRLTNQLNFDELRNKIASVAFSQGHRCGFKADERILRHGREVNWSRGC